MGSIRITAASLDCRWLAWYSCGRKLIALFLTTMTQTSCFLHLGLHMSEEGQSASVGSGSGQSSDVRQRTWGTEDFTRCAREEITANCGNWNFSAWRSALPAFSIEKSSQKTTTKYFCMGILISVDEYIAYCSCFASPEFVPLQVGLIYPHARALKIKSSLYLRLDFLLSET